MWCYPFGKEARNHKEKYENSQRQALITASATCGHAAGHRSPRTPLASGVAVLWPRTEARGVADAMIEARRRWLIFQEAHLGAHFRLDDLQIRPSDLDLDFDRALLAVGCGINLHQSCSKLLVRIRV